MIEMAKINNGFTSIEQVTGEYLNSRTKTQAAQQVTPETSFQDILVQKQLQTEETQELKFSKHAIGRLEERQIDLSTDQLDRLQSGAQVAGEKGIKDSLIMVDQLAFIVNIPNQTVVTAIDQAEAKNNVFTNIDGAVIM